MYNYIYLFLPHRVLRLVKRNRDLENELMKDVPGWKTGTWYGEPIYFTLHDKWIEPHTRVGSVRDFF